MELRDFGRRSSDVVAGEIQDYNLLCNRLHILRTARVLSSYSGVRGLVSKADSCEAVSYRVASRLEHSPAAVVRLPR